MLFGTSCCESAGVSLLSSLLLRDTSWFLVGSHPYTIFSTARLPEAFRAHHLNSEFLRVQSMQAPPHSRGPFRPHETTFKITQPSATHAPTPTTRPLSCRPKVFPPLPSMSFPATPHSEDAGYLSLLASPFHRAPSLYLSIWLFVCRSI